MAQLCWGVLFLGIAAAVNWAMGVYKKIGVEKLRWDWKEFVRGAVKIGLIIGSIIGLGIVWLYSGIDLSDAGLAPTTITTTATMYYAYKAIKYLGVIFNSNTAEDSGEQK